MAFYPSGSCETALTTPLRDRIQEQLTQARRDRDRHRTMVFSTLLSELRNREIETGRDADDTMVEEVVARAIKQRRDAASQMREGGREELAEKEDQEAGFLAEFLPPPLDENEVRSLIREILDGGVSEMGPLMGRLMPRIKGRFDGNEAKRLVREELSG